MDLLATMLVFSYFSDIFKAVISPELEKRLGRKPTDWDWQVYWEEMSKKAEFEAEQKMHRARQARLSDRQTIHDFVWNQNKGNPA